MRWPYIMKEVINAGSEEEPDYKPMPKLIWIPDNNAGPYQRCSSCRELKATNDKVKVNWSLPGAARCFKHTARFYRDMLTAGQIPQTLYDTRISYLEGREAINEKLRKGAYFNES